MWRSNMEVIRAPLKQITSPSPRHVAFQRLSSPAVINPDGSQTRLGSTLLSRSSCACRRPAQCPTNSTHIGWLTPAHSTRCCRYFDLLKSSLRVSQALERHAPSPRLSSSTLNDSSNGAHSNGNGSASVHSADGPRVAIMAEPSASFVAGTMGTWLHRGIAVPLCLSHPDRCGERGLGWALEGKLPCQGALPVLTLLLQPAVTTAKAPQGIRCA